MSERPETTDPDYLRVAANWDHFDDQGREIVLACADEIERLRARVVELEEKARERPPFTGASWDK